MFAPSTTRCSSSDPYPCLFWRHASTGSSAMVGGAPTPIWSERKPLRLQRLRDTTVPPMIAPFFGLNRAAPPRTAPAARRRPTWDCARAEVLACAALVACAEVATRAGGAEVARAPTPPLRECAVMGWIFLALIGGAEIRGRGAT